jgi:hypothetical protein
MKHLHFTLLLTLLLAACQAQTTTMTPIPPANTLIAATSAPKAASKSTRPAAPKVTSTPAGPAVHSSSSDSNASNLIVVRDQLIVNNSLMIDIVKSAQAGWIVIYIDKASQFGPQLVYAAVPAGRSDHFAIPLTQNINPSVNLPGLGGTLLDVVFQTNPSNPNTMVQANGVLVRTSFTLLLH